MLIITIVMCRVPAPLYLRIVQSPDHRFYVNTSLPPPLPPAPYPHPIPHSLTISFM